MALFLICVVLFCIGLAEHGVGRIWGLIGLAALVTTSTKFFHERKIVRELAFAVGTVLSFRKRRNKRGAEIKYGFKTDDNFVHLGKTAGVRVPKEDTTIGIAFSSNNPSCNLPISNFWFYEFSYTEYRQVETS